MTLDDFNHYCMQVNFVWHSLQTSVKKILLVSFINKWKPTAQLRKAQSQINCKTFHQSWNKILSPQKKKKQTAKSQTSPKTNWNCQFSSSPPTNFKFPPIFLSSFPKRTKLHFPICLRKSAVKEETVQNKNPKLLTSSSSSSVWHNSFANNNFIDEGGGGEWCASHSFSTQITVEKRAES